MRDSPCFDWCGEARERDTHPVRNYAVEILNSILNRSHNRSAMAATLVNPSTLVIVDRARPGKYAFQTLHPGIYAQSGLQSIMGGSTALEIRFEHPISTGARVYVSTYFCSVFHQPITKFGVDFPRSTLLHCWTQIKYESCS